MVVDPGSSRSSLGAAAAVERKVMPNVAEVLKAEIVRIARREVKKSSVSVNQAALRSKRAIAALNRQVAALEKEVRLLRRALARAQASSAPAATSPDRARITVKGVRSLRRRLGLSGEEFGRLVGVTGQAVYAWEKTSGPLKVRAATRAAILAIRSIGAREAKRRLAATAA